MSSRLKTALIALAFGAIWLSCACSSPLIKSLREQAILRQRLIDKYHERDINVNLRNFRHLSVTFINSPLNQQDSTQRAKRAQETAKFVVSNYPAIHSVETIYVLFARSETRAIFFHYNRTVALYRFDKNGVAVGAGFEEEDVRAPVARFNPSRNETDVSITRLQLEGDMNHGIALVPHFTVSGNANDRRSDSIAPQWVGLDFASYADPKTYSGDTALIISADGQVIFSGSARLLATTDTTSDGKASPQFLMAQITVPQFVKMADANEVKIKLGQKEFALSSDDVSSLHAMSKYLPARQG